MKYFAHLENDDTAYVTVHLSADEHKHLREWMHAREGENVCFPHAVQLFKRGFGWYRMDVSRNYRAADKLKHAVVILRAWLKAYNAARDQEIRLLIAQKNPKLQINSYQSDTNQFQVRDKDSGKIAPLHTPPVQQKLDALAAKFGRARA
jgi:hypothetical protein